MLAGVAPAHPRNNGNHFGFSSSPNIASMHNARFPSTHVAVARILVKMWLLASADHPQQSVQRTTAAVGATQTRNLRVLGGKLVVVRDLFVDADWLPGVDHYLLLRLHSDDLRIAVRLRRKHGVNVTVSSISHQHQRL